MDNKKPVFSKTRKLKIAIALAAVFILTGVSFLVYPYVTDFFSYRNQVKILEEWDKEITGVTETTAVNIDNSNAKESQNDKQKPVETATISNTSEDDAGIQNNFNELDYSNLSAEDFFPLRISIPKIELEWIVNEGSDTKTLKKGPGHIIETVLPGDIGRCVISGHRTIYEAPFNKIDELGIGDLIYLESLNKEIFSYAVTNLIVVNPQDVYILDGSLKKELLLTTCEPEYSAAKRLVVIAELINIYEF